jgi:hypothetical protein
MEMQGFETVSMHAGSVGLYAWRRSKSHDTLSFEHDVEQIFEQQGRLDAFTILWTSRPFHQVIVGRN